MVKFGVNKKKSVWESRRQRLFRPSHGVVGSAQTRPRFTDERWYVDLIPLSNPKGGGSRATVLGGPSHGPLFLFKPVKLLVERFNTGIRRSGQATHKQENGREFGAERKG